MLCIYRCPMTVQKMGSGTESLQKLLSGSLYSSFKDPE